MINKTNLLVLALLAGLASSLEHEKPHKDGRCRCICPSLKDALPLFNASQVNELVLNRWADLNNESRSTPTVYPYRQIYIESTEPDACGCDQVVLPRILDDPGVLAVEEALQLEQKFCPRWVDKKYLYLLRIHWWCHLQMCLHVWNSKHDHDQGGGHFDTLHHLPSGPVHGLPSLHLPLLCQAQNIGAIRIQGAAQSGWRKSSPHLLETPFSMICLFKDTGEGIFEPAPTDSELGFVMRTRPLGNSMFHRVGAQQSKWHRTVQEQRRNIYDRHSMLNWVQTRREIEKDDMICIRLKKKCLNKIESQLVLSDWLGSCDFGKGIKMGGMEEKTRHSMMMRLFDRERYVPVSLIECSKTLTQRANKGNVCG